MSGSNVTIILIDDDEVLLEMYEKKLSLSGFEVLTAHNGGDGVKIASANKPDLILTVLVMPITDGFEVLRRIKSDKAFKDIEIIAGNVATAEAASDLIKLGADAIKIGVGPGSICTTRVIAGIGVPQITAIQNAIKGRGKTNVPLIADGGIRYSGDIVKALAAGADAVMIGQLFAATEESPGELTYFNGRMFKVYRGMGSMEAMSQGARDRYGLSSNESANKLIPEGIVGQTLYKGKLSDHVHQLVGGIRAGLGYVGAKNIKELHQKAEFIRISHSSLKESHPHDIDITKEAPNYQRLEFDN